MRPSSSSSFDKSTRSHLQKLVNNICLISAKKKNNSKLIRVACIGLLHNIFCVCYGHLFVLNMKCKTIIFIFFFSLFFSVLPRKNAIENLLKKEIINKMCSKFFLFFSFPFWIVDKICYTFNDFFFLFFFFLLRN